MGIMKLNLFYLFTFLVSLSVQSQSPTNNEILELLNDCCSQSNYEIGSDLTHNQPMEGKIWFLIKCEYEKPEDIIKKNNDVFKVSVSTKCKYGKGYYEIPKSEDLYSGKKRDAVKYTEYKTKTGISDYLVKFKSGNFITVFQQTKKGEKYKVYPKWVF